MEHNLANLPKLFKEAPIRINLKTCWRGKDGRQMRLINLNAADFIFARIS